MSLSDLNEPWAQDWVARHRACTAAGFAPTQLLMTLTCLHCRQLSEGHADGKCLFMDTTYEPWGEDNFTQANLLRSDWMIGKGFHKGTVP